MSAFPATSDGADVLVTAAGYAQLCAELEALRTVSRQELSEQLRDVREDGDPDNPMMFDLLEEQAQLEGRIALLEAQAAAHIGVGRGAGRPSPCGPSRRRHNRRRDAAGHDATRAPQRRPRCAARSEGGGVNGLATCSFARRARARADRRRRRASR